MRMLASVVLHACVLASSAIAAAGCSARSADIAAVQPTPSDPITSPPPRAPRPAGVPVPDTLVQVTRDVPAGGTIRVQAPPGSRIDIGDTSFAVHASARIELPAPRTSGNVRIRVTRPDGRTLAFRVTVHQAGRISGR